MTAETETAAPEQDAPSGLEALAELQPQEEAVPVEPKIDDLGRAYATGRRKNAIARVWIKPGNGRVTVNGRDQEQFFARPVLRMIIKQPFDVTSRVDQFDVMCTVTGGGLSGHPVAAPLAPGRGRARLRARGKVEWRQQV